MSSSLSLPDGVQCYFWLNYNGTYWLSSDSSSGGTLIPATAWGSVSFMAINTVGSDGDIAYNTPLTITLAGSGGASGTLGYANNQLAPTFASGGTADTTFYLARPNCNPASNCTSTYLVDLETTDTVDWTVGSILYTMPSEGQIAFLVYNDTTGPSTPSYFTFSAPQPSTVNTMSLSAALLYIDPVSPIFSTCAASCQPFSLLDVASTCMSSPSGVGTSCFDTQGNPILPASGCASACSPSAAPSPSGPGIIPSLNKYIPYIAIAGGVLLAMFVLYLLFRKQR